MKKLTVALTVIIGVFVSSASSFLNAASENAEPGEQSGKICLVRQKKYRNVREMISKEMTEQGCQRGDRVFVRGRGGTTNNWYLNLSLAYICEEGTIVEGDISGFCRYRGSVLDNRNDYDYLNN